MNSNRGSLCLEDDSKIKSTSDSTTVLFNQCHNILQGFIRKDASLTDARLTTSITFIASLVICANKPRSFNSRNMKDEDATVKFLLIPLPQFFILKGTAKIWTQIESFPWLSCSITTISFILKKFFHLKFALMVLWLPFWKNNHSVNFECKKIEFSVDRYWNRINHAPQMIIQKG